MTSSFTSPPPFPPPPPSPSQMEEMQIEQAALEDYARPEFTLAEEFNINQFKPSPMSSSISSPPPFPLLLPPPHPSQSPSQMEEMQIEQTALEDDALPEFTLAEEFNIDQIKPSPMSSSISSPPSFPLLLPPPPPSPSQMEEMQIEQTALKDDALPEFTLAEEFNIDQFKPSPMSSSISSPPPFPLLLPPPPPSPSPSQMEEMQIEQTALKDDALPEFTLAEIIEMESAYKKKDDESLTQKSCQELATKFSFSVHRIGKPAIHWKQVQNWFEDKKKRVAAKVTSSPTVIGKSLIASNAKMPKHSVKATPPSDIFLFSSTQRAFSEIDICQRPKAERVSELSELVFEALSSKDDAWYDVAAFLNFRNLYNGELEARVRFAGFGHDEDEWVNVRRRIRERSLPLEPSECHKIKVGDLVLAYRANEDHALYSDANIVDIHRRTHDDSICSCIFVVCFQYDNKEGHLQLSEICCRPNFSSQSTSCNSITLFEGL